MTRFTIKPETRGGTRFANWSADLDREQTITLISSPEVKRIGLIATRDGDAARRLNFNKRDLAARLDEILAWIDTHKTDDRPSSAIMAEIGLARILFETACDRAAH